MDIARRRCRGHKAVIVIVILVVLGVSRGVFSAQQLVFGAVACICIGVGYIGVFCNRVSAFCLFR